MFSTIQFSVEQTSVRNEESGSHRRLVISFIAAFPLSIRLADPFFTLPFHKDWYQCVLLVWPDHVKTRSFDDLAEVSPRPKDSSYSFNVAPDREAWVEEQVRRLPSPNGNASWAIHVNA